MEKASSAQLCGRVGKNLNITNNFSTNCSKRHSNKYLQSAAKIEKTYEKVSKDNGKLKKLVSLTS